MYLILLSCKEKEKSFDKNLYDIVLSYQKENQIPYRNLSEIHKDSPDNSYNFIYEIKFDIEKKDTIMEITLRPQGINKLSTCYGVYKDEKLYPTIVIDNNMIGKTIIKNYKKIDLQRYLNKHKSIIDKNYPIYIYQLKHQNLIFIETIK